MTEPTEIIGGRLLGPLEPGEAVTIECDDTDSPTPSTGDDATRSVVFGFDPGEDVTCTFHLATASDAGPAGLTPRAGRWKTRETDVSVECPFPIKGKPGRTETRRLSVSDDGDKLSGIRVGGKQVRLKRDAGRPEHFVGKAKVRQRGLPATLVIDWTVDSPDHVTGTNEITFKAGGQTCSISRTFEMTHQGN